MSVFVPQLKLQIRFLIVAGLLLTPYFGAMGTTLWKDTPYAIFILLGLIHATENINRGLRHKIVSIFLITLGISMRHEGIIIMILFFLILCLKILIQKKHHLKNASKQLIPIVLVSACLSYGFHQIVLVSQNIKPAPKSSIVMGMLGELGYVASYYPEKLSPTTLNLLSTISSGSSYAGFQDCRSINGFVFSQGFDFKVLEKNWTKVLSAYFTSMPRAWKDFFYAHVCRTASFLPPPVSTGPGYRSWTVLNIYEINPQGLKNMSPIVEMRELMLNWRSGWESRSQIIAWPGLFILIFFMKRRSFTQNMPIGGPANSVFQNLAVLVLAQWIFLIALAGAQDTRYANIILWVTIILLMKLLLEFLDKKNSSIGRYLFKIDKSYELVKFDSEFKH
jgi:hypothetical protein